MQNNWGDEHREVLAAMDDRADALKDRVTQKWIEPVTMAVPPTSPIEHNRSWQIWILIILLWGNIALLFHITRDILSGLVLSSGGFPQTKSWFAKTQTAIQVLELEFGFRVTVFALRND